MSSEFQHYRNELDTLKADNATLRALFQTERQQNRRERRRLRVQSGLAFVALIGAIFLSPANRSAIAQGYGITLASLNARLLSVENKTQYVNVDGGEMYVRGTNLHIENGVPNPGVFSNGFLARLLSTAKATSSSVITTHVPVILAPTTTARAATT